jgi:hypothetical protein
VPERDRIHFARDIRMRQQRTDLDRIPIHRRAFAYNGDANVIANQMDDRSDRRARVVAIANIP